ncbi:PqqD family protein [Natronococcus pandeyae]|uniref:PqqD family protein n=1 Tax=Natronococcus pandeyae TaxID=2055836 RepID=A0A8J8Q4Y6_9EURY|nr:PqqD family protein [Natronococcus pandeyae]TYL38892.1 PqqD family protein [Natronococcus pandeyae]
MEAYSADATVRAVRDHVSTELEGEQVILQLETGTYYGVDGIGPFVWERLQEPITIDELCRSVVVEYDVDRRRVETDLEALLVDLEKARLIERTDG